jgi:hypothetical protein
MVIGYHIFDKLTPFNLLPAAKNTLSPSNKLIKYISARSGLRGASSTQLVLSYGLVMIFQISGKLMGGVPL